MSLIKNLKRDYGDFAIDIPHWELSDKGITALWGPSGSGKTSVFRLLLGLEPCPSLQWIFKGEDLAQLKTPSRRLGVVFQSLELFPHMSAQKNIEFAARARKIENAEEKINNLMRQLKLEGCWQRPAHLLSGGEQQRVALARALVGEPRFLFLDEPFSALDAHLKSEARQLVKDLIERLNIPTLLISHDPEDVSALAHTTVKIHNGALS